MKNSIYIMVKFPCLVLLLLTVGCQQTKTADDDFEQAVRNQTLEYFETFVERTDWVKFRSYDRENIHFKDITLQ